MFVLPASVIIYSVLAFGAVAPYQFLVLNWLCVAICAVGLCLSIIKRGNAELAWVLAVGILAFYVGDARHGAALMIGVWTLLAARRADASQTSRFLLLLTALGIFEAAFGFYQYFWAPGWVWGYHNPFYKAAGTLANRNHYAGLLEMLTPTAIAGAYYALMIHREIERASLYLMAALLMTTAVVLSMSRMGMLSLAAGIVVMCILMPGRFEGRKGYLLAATLTGLIGFSVFWVGIDSIATRFEQVQDPDGIVREGRVALFSSVEEMIRRNPSGVGVGQFENAFRRYQVANMRTRYDHAHNDYLEFAVELGIPVFLSFLFVLAAAFVFMIYRFLRSPSPRIRSYLIASIGAIVGIGVHSFADFNLQIPGNAILFSSIFGLGLGVALRRDPAQDPTF